MIETLFVLLNNYLSPHIHNHILLDLCVAGFVTLMLCMIVVIVGVVVNTFENLVFKILRRFLGHKFAVIVCNYLTFPGVMLHELAHAVMIIATGGKITHMKLFEICPDGRLGHVDFCVRGRFKNQMIQLACSSCAPVIFGFVEIYVLYRHVLILTIGSRWYYLVWYMIISIGFHMSMSNQDLKLYFRGLIYVFPVVLVSMMVLQYFVFR